MKYKTYNSRRFGTFSHISVSERRMGNIVEKIILTASGGPFRTFSQLQLETVAELRIRASNWDMGDKITVIRPR